MTSYFQGKRLFFFPLSFLCLFDISVLWFLSLKDSCFTSGINQKRKTSYPVKPGPGGGIKGHRNEEEEGRMKDHWRTPARPNTTNYSRQHGQNREANQRRERRNASWPKSRKEDTRQVMKVPVGINPSRKYRAHTPSSWRAWEVSAQSRALARPESGEKHY